MENFFVVIVTILFAIYSLYKNYQKEMDKSKSRRPEVRPKPIPIEIPKHKINNNPEIQYTSTEVPEEVLAAQKRKKIKEVAKPTLIQRIKDQDDVDKNNTAIEFDLRSAIIQSAILERPYK